MLRPAWYVDTDPAWPTTPPTLGQPLDDLLHRTAAVYHGHTPTTPEHTSAALLLALTAAAHLREAMTSPREAFADPADFHRVIASTNLLVSHLAQGLHATADAIEDRRGPDLTAMTGYARDQVIAELRTAAVALCNAAWALSCARKWAPR